MIELRWIECDRSDKEPPQATHPGWPECGPTYFKLQSRFIKEWGGSDDITVPLQPVWSEWADVPINTPL